MTTVMKTSYPGWNNHPVYYCSKFEDWHEISSWMYKNESDHFLLSSGSNGYIFQVRANLALFLLRWA
jgi:uncharacterized secreted protein with C-terminal beta-propeller domain